MSRNKEKDSKSSPVLLVVATIGAMATIVAALISYSAGKEAILIPIRTTQTAEAKQPPPIQTVVIVQTPTPVDTPTPTATPTPIPYIIDTMDILDWNLGFCDASCGGLGGSSSIIHDLVPGKSNDAIEILYYLNNRGWVQISKDKAPKVLEGTRGISFFYKGSGAANTLELKVILNDETTYGASWNRATDTDDRWTLLQALYGENIRCLWPENLCQQHGTSPVLTAVKRVEIAISNKPGDTAGLGKVALDDLVGIP